MLRPENQSYSAMNDLAIFATLVARMRTSQQKYFKNRSKSNLNDAIKLEAEVDRQLREIAPQAVGVASEVAEQKRLFD